MNQKSLKKSQVLLAEGIELGAKGEVEKAADIMMQAASDQGFDFLIKVAQALEEIKRFGKAQQIYGQAMQLEPKNFLTYSKLGGLFAELENFPLAVRNLEKAIELNPAAGGLYYNLGLAYQSAGEIDKAIEAIEMALENGTEAFLVYGTLARIYEQANLMEKLSEVVKAGLKVAKNDPFLNLHAAILERRQDNPEAALRRLQTFLAPEMMKHHEEQREELEKLKILKSFEFARNYDKLGDYDKAYQHFVEGNRLAAADPFAYPLSKEQALAEISALRQLKYSKWQETSADPLDNPALTPVFLVGFPRSGTTLLHQILDAHTDLEVLEEQPVLAALTEYINRQMGGFPDGLKDADTQMLNQMRDSYLKGVSKLQSKPGDIRIIDKLPMNIIKIPLMLKLFPDAKFILALRHPCDCTLSCFMQNFTLNNSMINFLTLDDATHYYDQTFSLWNKYCSEMKLDFHTISYEDVITDLEKEARRVISYLGLDWQDQVLNYRDQAKEKKRINTPSYHQVVKPIYQDAKGRWLRYQKYMGSYMERLSPYIEQFGYQEKD